MGKITLEQYVIEKEARIAEAEKIENEEEEERRKNRMIEKHKISLLDSLGFKGLYLDTINHKDSTYLILNIQKNEIPSYNQLIEEIKYKQLPTNENLDIIYIFSGTIIGGIMGGIIYGQTGAIIGGAVSGIGIITSQNKIRKHNNELYINPTIINRIQNSSTDLINRGNSIWNSLQDANQNKSQSNLKNFPKQKLKSTLSKNYEVANTYLDEIQKYHKKCDEVSSK